MMCHHVHCIIYYCITMSCVILYTVSYIIVSLGHVSSCTLYHVFLYHYVMCHRVHCIICFCITMSCVIIYALSICFALCIIVSLSHVSSYSVSLHHCITQSCTLGCSENFKNAKSNYGYSYFMAPWYIETEKTHFF